VTEGKARDKEASIRIAVSVDTALEGADILVAEAVARGEASSRGSGISLELKIISTKESSEESSSARGENLFERFRNVWGEDGGVTFL
jgi:hypothetical protein